MSAIDTAIALQADLEARCNAEPYFTDVVVVSVQPTDLEVELDKKLATLVGKGGKRGAAILVLPIEDQHDEMPEVQFGPLKLSIAFQVAEWVLLNRKAGGTDKPGRKIARRLRDLFAHYTPVGFVHSLVPEANCIEPVTLAKKNLLGWQVNFTAQEADEEILMKVARPVFTAVANTVQIACTTVGAAIYYTTDGSHPWSGNTAATLYSAPVAIPPAGITLRACAFKTAWIASDVSRQSFTQT